MITTETTTVFLLSSVKPLDSLAEYRQFCIQKTKEAFKNKTIERFSPVNGKSLTNLGEIDGLSYGVCEESQGFFLSKMPPMEDWQKLLNEVNQKRFSPKGFHAEVDSTRMENVYRPKLDWIQNTLRIVGLTKPKLLEVTVLPSRLTSLLKSSGIFSEVITVDETDLAQGKSSVDQVDVAILFESLDRAWDPKSLIKFVKKSVKSGGLIFVTGLVSSGYDMTILGIKNMYLYPPDRANCFSRQGIQTFLKNSEFELIESSTPGVLDIEIVLAHLNHGIKVSLSPFDKSILFGDLSVRTDFQSFLQKAGLSSFLRIVGRNK